MLVDAPRPSEEAVSVTAVTAARNLSSVLAPRPFRTAFLKYPSNIKGIPFIITKSLSAPFILTVTLCVGDSALNVLGIGAVDVDSIPVVPSKVILSPMTFSSPEYEILPALSSDQDDTLEVETSAFLIASAAAALAAVRFR